MATHRNPMSKGELFGSPLGVWFGEHDCIGRRRFNVITATREKEHILANNPFP